MQTAATQSFQPLGSANRIGKPKELEASRAPLPAREQQPVVKHLVAHGVVVDAAKHAEIEAYPIHRLTRAHARMKRYEKIFFSRKKDC